MNRSQKFRVAWWSSNVLLVASLIGALGCGAWEYSVRQYLDGFGDAVVAHSAPPQQKAEAILDWMRSGPPRMNSAAPGKLSTRDPRTTLNYQELLDVCGTATNAFLNLARSSGVPARRLLLLTPERTVKHVVVEVNVDGRWTIVDPTYRAFLRDAKGNLLTREELQSAQTFAEATRRIANYNPDYSYERFAHVRLAAVPLVGGYLRDYLGDNYPDWDGALDWSLLLERRSFLWLFLSVSALMMLLIARSALGWMADHRLHLTRFHLRANLARAATTFFSTPEIK